MRGVDWVESTKRQVYFTARGMYRGKDPYPRPRLPGELRRDGLTPLTEAAATTTVAYSPDRQYYVDTWSRVDLPQSCSSAGRRRPRPRRPEKATRARSSPPDGAPPRCSAPKDATGRPTSGGSSSARQLRPGGVTRGENIYAGPHSAHGPRRSARSWHAVLAELGFIVFQIDGMGTSTNVQGVPRRGWKNLGDAGFPNESLAQGRHAKYPNVDITRVGHYGTSAGGQNAMARCCSSSGVLQGRRLRGGLP